MRFVEMIELLEASKYDAMFDRISKIQFLRNKQAFSDSAQEHITWARKNLKREDRIVWYLRLAKYQLFTRMLSEYPDDANIANTFPDETDNHEIEAEKKTIQRDIAKLESRIGASEIGPADLGPGLNRVKQNLLHYLGQEQIETIQNFRFSDQSPIALFRELDSLEDEWRKSVDEDTVEVKEGDRMIAKFDGGKRAWWLLERGACRAEADAMGHCGNLPSEKPGDRILSFRTKITDTRWKPHLTFIRDSNGLLGEMKGRGNEKPAERYHPYIIALLKKTKIVKGIKGGGYQPENNFSLNDLDDETREELINLNPNLITVFDKYRKFGATPDVIAGLEERHYESQLPGISSIGEKTVELESWDDLESFARDLNIKPLKKLFEKIEDEADLVGDSLRDSELQDMADEMNVDEETYSDILSRMPTEILQKIADDLEINTDVSTYRGVMRISEKIDKSEHGDRIRRAITKTQDFSDQIISKHPDLGDFVEAVFSGIYRASRNYYAGIKYDKNNIAETDVTLTMNTDDFVDILKESFESYDTLDDDEAFYIANAVISVQNWLGSDSYDLRNSWRELGKEKTDDYSDFSENEQEIYQRFMIMIDEETQYKISNIKPVEVARETIRMMQYNENHELERIKQLSGI